MAVRQAQSQEQTFFHGPGQDRDLDIRRRQCLREGVKAARIAFGHQQRLLHVEGRLGKVDASRPLRRDEHAGGDDVEAPGFQSGDQRSEFGLLPFDAANAQSRDDQFGHFRGFSGYFTTRFQKGVRRFDRVSDPDGSLRPEPG